MTEDIRLGPSTKVARQCACRGFLIATPGSSEVADAVVKHQEMPEHQRWDRDAWINANTAQTVVRIVATRKVA